MAMLNYVDELKKVFVWVQISTCTQIFCFSSHKSVLLCRNKDLL